MSVSINYNCVEIKTKQKINVCRIEILSSFLLEMYVNDRLNKYTQNADLNLKDKYRKGTFPSTKNISWTRLKNAEQPFICIENTKSKTNPSPLEI